MATLESMMLAKNPQDAGPTEPPTRQRKITISYAGAVKAGILKPSQATNNRSNTSQDNDTEIQTIDITQESSQATTQRQVSWDGSVTETSRSLGSSLSRSVSNSKMINFKREIETEIKEMKQFMNQRLVQQDQHLHDIKHSIENLTQDLESKMAVAVIGALMQEKDKVQELTLGKTYGAEFAPLADKDGILPGGVKTQAGGPLDQLHHVEITVMRMVSILDTIADHLQMDPIARHLFEEDDEDEIKAQAANEDRANTNNLAGQTEEEYLNYYIDNDVPMTMLKENSAGIKRGLQRQKTSSHSHHDIKILELDTPSSPQQTPPSKRERSDSKPSAKPDGKARARGET
jgi:hypothetical protein